MLCKAIPRYNLHGEAVGSCLSDMQWQHSKSEMFENNRTQSKFPIHLVRYALRAARRPTPVLTSSLHAALTSLSFFLFSLYYFPFHVYFYVYLSMQGAEVEALVGDGEGR